MRFVVLGLGLLLCSSSLAQEAPDEPDSSSSEADSSSAGELSEEQLARATALFENGRTLYEEARYRDAITAWEECYKLSGRPQLLFNLANAHERLAEYDKAIDVLNKYRIFAEPEEKGALERRVNNLDRLAREKREAEEAAVATAAATEEKEAPPPPFIPPTKSKTDGKKLAGLALIGVGGVAIASGVGFGLSSAKVGRDALEFCVDTEGGKPLCSTEAQGFLDLNKSQALLSDVSFGVGVSSAVVGAILVVSGQGKTVSVGVNSVRLSGRF